MATHLNEVHILGTIGQDPELRQTGTGTSVANFSLATNKKFKTKDGENKEDTQWHNVQIWAARGEAFARHNNKGDTVWVRGELRTDTWDKDGQTQYKTSIVANDWGFVHAKGAGGGPGQSGGAAPSGPPPSNPANDDLPF